MTNNRTEGQILQDKLTYKVKNSWEKMPDDEYEKVFSFCDSYMEFMNEAKTEREFTRLAEKLLQQKGYLQLEEAYALNGQLLPGMKVYRVTRKKGILAAVLGRNPIEDGLNIVGAHIDSPRIDFKQNPLYEDSELAMLKTHYYGGIKKYQWVSIPLAVHGVVVKETGESIEICIGEAQDDPVFTITDLLPHLAVEQMQKKMSEAITGEGLNLLLGSIPYKDEKIKDKVKLNMLRLLSEKYGIQEEDFVSAELEIVPAFKARDVGLDKSMVGAYGQDDRVCAYSALRALLEVQAPERTSVCYLCDKEEVGSMGNTGALSKAFENFVAELCAYSAKSYSDLALRKCLEASKLLSADVNAAVDPNYEGVLDKRNAPYVGKGIVIQKYTGVRGKVDANDASAEFLAEVRRLFNENHIPWQTGELGKVDQGGGGTIAQYMANHGIETVDCGVPVLSMHSPFEITSKIDVYTAYRAYHTFFEKMS